MKLMSDFMNHGTIGIDEVGRGPLAGPVVVCCVFLPNDINFPSNIVVRDSKKMSHKQRVNTIDWIKTQSNIKFQITEVPVEVIDKINILKATMFGMKQAFEGVSQIVKPENYEIIYVDGNRAPELRTDKDIITVIGGDNEIPAISLASILAKEYRDDLMKEIHKEFPVYCFADNVGYGTKKHLEALKQYGYSKYHRKSFAPIKDMIPL